THLPNALWTPSFERRPIAFLPDKVHLLCGIAVPSRFADTVHRLGVTITSRTFAGDHHLWTDRELRLAVRTATANGALAILTTLKDLARIQRISVDLPLWGLGTELVFTAGEGLLTGRLAQVLKK
ncbi:MAG: tetraacyldisaccharide 4'-kinase, partial [Deltaproteobacteria bacterium]|nr:tetraacyldisaccharide 4'-kinase [Deltaproteobacteria bacterium]